MATVWRVPATRLFDLGTQLLQRTGSNPTEAATVASNLVLSNLKGVDSHGIGYLPRYVRVAQEGGLKTNASLVVKNAASSSAIVRCDGQMGYGQVLGEQALRLGIERCRTHGVAVVSLANCHHLGRIGAWAEQAVAAGFCSIHLTNVAGHSPLVAPHVGADSRLGTNPFTVGCIPMRGSSEQPRGSDDFHAPNPATDEFPLVLDYATSEMALGRLRECFARGEPAPPGAVLDKRGAETRDASVMFTAVEREQGALLPFAGHKGYALSFMCEHAHEATSGSLAAITNSMLTILLDPAAVSGRSATEIQTAAAGVARYMRESPLRPDVCTGEGSRVLVPGEKEAHVFADRSKHGIPLARGTYQALVQAAAEVGMERQTVNEVLAAEIMEEGPRR